jgi:hypothetical protein
VPALRTLGIPGAPQTPRLMHNSTGRPFGLVRGATRRQGPSVPPDTQGISQARDFGPMVAESLTRIAGCGVGCCGAGMGLATGLNQDAEGAADSL